MDPSFLNNNPNLNGISSEKINFLMDFASKNQTKSPREMLPLFLAATTSARKQGLEFSSNETSIILDLLKQNMNDEERKKVDYIVSVFAKYQK